METVYLDHNASGPLWPEVAQRLSEGFARQQANPASQHAPGQTARRILEDARDRVGELLGARAATVRPDAVIFTSGGTEANNLALFGLAGREPGRVIVSAIEHPCVLEAAAELVRRGWQVERLAASTDGRVDPAELEERLATPAQLVSVMLANHETGVIQPIDQIAHICQQLGVPLHCDAVQAAGKLRLDLQELPITALAISAHKFGGPVGVGALVVRAGTALEPQLFGGSQQGRLRPGTESPVLAAALCQALEIWEARRDELVAGMQSQLERFEQTLTASLPEIEINGAAAPRLPQTSNVALIGTDRQSMLLALDTAGVACSTGSACESGSAEPSPVLTAMGCSAGVISSSLRFSFGPGTTAVELDSANKRIINCYKDLRSRKSASFSPSAARSRP